MVASMSSANLAHLRERSAEAAVETAAKRFGHVGGWKMGPDVDQEVFAADEYRNHAQPQDYTRPVVVIARSR